VIDRFLQAHHGPSSTGLGNGRLERLALHLFLAGRVDAASLRLERTLASELPEGARVVLLALFARLREGHPQATAADIAEELSIDLDLEPQRWPRDFDAVLHRELVSRFKTEIVAIASEVSAGLAADPSVFGRLFGSPDRDPLPLVCHRDGVFAFARLQAAQEELVERVGAFRMRASDLPEARIDTALRELDGMSGPPLHAAQRRAVELALRKSFAILTGGPGTGKTTVVSRILLALARCLDGFDAETMVLCAPTGRAKARISESVGRNLSELAASDPAVAAIASIQASTLHSLLGVRPDGSYRHHAENPLPHRVAILDEASMVDLPLFAAFLAALRDDARLVVVGDPDQLPSVDAGAVLADLVGNSALVDHRVHLVHTHRNAGEIAEICQIVVDGGNVAGWLASHPCGDPETLRSRTGGVGHLRDGDLEVLVGNWLDQRFGDSLRKAGRVGFSDPLPLLDAVESSRILCAVHDGGAGIQNLNRLGDHWLRTRFPANDRGLFAPGQQVILTRNHPARDLWNGDLGVVVRQEDRLMAAFGKSTGILMVPLTLLDGLESAWAVTVHKSQGSEFDEILFVLPDRDAPVLTRQILYTALSRARRTVLVHGDPDLASKAVGRSADRPGRLRDALFV